MITSFSGDKETAVTSLRELPRRPQLIAVTNETYENAPACGSTKGQEIVTLSGKHLQSVKAVFFGNKKATITDRTSERPQVVAPEGKGRVAIFVAPEEACPNSRTGGLGFTYSETACGERKLR